MKCVQGNEFVASHKQTLSWNFVVGVLRCGGSIDDTLRFRSCLFIVTPIVWLNGKGGIHLPFVEKGKFGSVVMERVYH